MDTSSSPDPGTACAFLFSGRSDPCWAIADGLIAQVGALWDSLPPAAGRPAERSGLGYRGCLLRDRAVRTWEAYGGLVTLIAYGRVESRYDPERTFEKTVIASAPAGLVPCEMVDVAVQTPPDGL
jgi:hypothetical protein